VQRWEDEPDRLPFVKGELLHCGLAHLYKRKQLEDKGLDPDAYYKPHEAVGVLAMRNSMRSDMWQEQAPMVQEALVAYEQEWMPDDHWEILHVEKELKARVRDEERLMRGRELPKGHTYYLYTQRADLIVRDKGTGKIWIIDHKSTYRIAPKTVRRYTLSGQFIGYRLLGRAQWGREFAGVRLNMVQLSSEFKFSRPRLEPAPATDDRFKTTILYGERLIADMTEQHGVDTPWPQTFADSTCWSSYGPCPMYELCQWGEP
jgi:hypothetical protein